LLAALDAAQGEAVGYVWPGTIDGLRAGNRFEKAILWSYPSGQAGVPLYLAPQAQPAAVPVQNRAPTRTGLASQCYDVAQLSTLPAWCRDLLAKAADALSEAQPAAVPAANVTPMRQPRADLARLVESINAAVYANGDGLSVTEAIGALELAKLELLKEQGQ
ncbi:hypothetical protein, partial [Pseudomonas sp.]|uniref:hypothetical protein n=1 Tax=Pseudomonas sp. TaxID=306 RepID=UPI0033414754